MLAVQNSSSGKVGTVICDLGPNGSLTIGLNVGGSSQLTHTAPRHFASDSDMRNFVVSSAETFTTAQTLYDQHHPNPVPQNILAGLSRKYRSSVIELVEAQKVTSDLVSATLYTTLDFVWHFCEVMFITSHPDIPILPYLTEWMHSNFDRSAETLPLIVQELPDLEPTSIDKLWTVIYELVFHGRTVDAAQILPYINSGVNYSEALSEQITLLVELLKKRPAFHPTVNSVTDFEAAWYKWREECVSRVEQRAFHSSEKLNFIARIMAGDVNAFTQARMEGHIHTWYEYMVMMVCYTSPIVLPSGLKAVARQTMMDLGIGEILSEKDELLLHAMNLDIVNVIRLMQSHWQHPWFALHFSDLVYAGGQINTSSEIRIDYGSLEPLRNHFVLEYGVSLMQHSTLWQVGVRYMQTLPGQGTSAIRECIQRIKPKTDLEAQKIIQVAERLSLGVEIHGLCKQLALRKLALGQPQNALLWAIKAGDGPLTTYIVDSILFSDDCFLEPALLESLKNSLPCADRLLFLNGYSDLRKLIDQGDLKEATTKLCQLIRDDIIPLKIAPKIIQCIQQLGEANVHFDTAETNTIMDFVQCRLRSALTDEDLKKVNSLLICNRAHQILTAFKNSKRSLL